MSRFSAVREYEKAQEKAKKSRYASNTVAIPAEEIEEFSRSSFAQLGFKAVPAGTKEAIAAMSFDEMVDKAMLIELEEKKKKYGKNYLKNPAYIEKVSASVDKMRAAQKAQRTADVAKAREDMRSGKTSSLVGKTSDPYAGVQGPLPMYKDQEAADVSGQSRYLLGEEEQYKPSPAYVGKSEAQRAEMETSGEYPDVGKYEKTKGKGVEVRKAIPTKQVFKAMVQGDPTQDRVFDTKKEAEDYLKSRGVKGAVAGVRMTGGSGEEIKAKESKYREQAGSAAKKEKELKALYDKRRTAAQERMGKVSEGKIGAREAGIESQIEDIAETSPERAIQFKTGLQNIEDKRAAREAAITSQRIKNVAEGKAGMPFGESDRLVKMENRANKRVRDLQIMYEKAVAAGDFDLAMDIENEINSTIGTDPRSTESRMRFFKQKLSRANPF